MPSRSHVLLPLLFLIPLALGLGACGDSPTDVHSSPASLSTLCRPAGTQVSCTASFFAGAGGERDVTADAAWLVSDPSAGLFVRPGVFSPSRRGEVAVSARYRQVETRYQFRFLVDPLATPRYLQFLSGDVLDDLANTPIAGAAVEILSGYSEGARTTSSPSGFYTFPTVLAGETFTLRVASPGYATVTTSYRVDPSVFSTGDPSNPPFLNFRLRKVE